MDPELGLRILGFIRQSLDTCRSGILQAGGLQLGLGFGTGEPDSTVWGPTAWGPTARAIVF